MASGPFGGMSSAGGVLVAMMPSRIPWVFVKILMEGP